MNGELKIFSGRANRVLAEEICAYAKIQIGECKISDFADGEVSVRIGENVRGKDIFVIQPTCNPANTNLIELLVMIDALKRASAKRITAVIPYYGYARQDRKTEPRVPITAKLIADLLTAVGINKVLTMDLHAGQIQGFFDMSVDHLYAMPVLIEYFEKKKLEKVSVISPDAGGVERARAFAKRLQCSLAIIDKRRDRPGVAKAMHVIGDIAGRDVIVVDDIIDSAGTITEAARALLENGARDIYTCCTHPVLSGSAVDRLSNSVIKEVVVTDTIPVMEKAENCNKIKVLSVAHLLGEAILRIHSESSVSSLFL